MFPIYENQAVADRPPRLSETDRHSPNREVETLPTFPTFPGLFLDGRESFERLVFIPWRNFRESEIRNTTKSPNAVSGRFIQYFEIRLKYKQHWHRLLSSVICLDMKPHLARLFRLDLQSKFLAEKSGSTQKECFNPQLTCILIEASSTLCRLYLKTQLYCYGYGFRPH